jgi:hypothetical protein
MKNRTTLATRSSVSRVFFSELIPRGFIDSKSGAENVGSHGDVALADRQINASVRTCANYLVALAFRGPAAKARKVYSAFAGGATDRSAASIRAKLAIAFNLTTLYKREQL